MKNVARFSDNDKRRLFRNTADKMGLTDAIVEKDFWVCFALERALVETLQHEAGRFQQRG